MTALRTRRVLALVLSGALAAIGAAPALADTVILKSGKKLKDVVAFRDGDVVVVNPFNSTHPGMTWGLEKKDRIPAEKVAEIKEGPPLVEYRQKASQLNLTAADHLELAADCEKHKFKAQRLRHLQLALTLEPGNEAALKAFGGAAKWKGFARGNPEVDPELRRLEREYVQLEGVAELAAQWSQMKALGTKRKLFYLERARRSFRLGKEVREIQGSPMHPAGRQEKRPITFRSDQSPGGTYCLYVPSTYDPFEATPLLIGLHGGGRGGVDGTLVTGNGESAMNFYEREAEAVGWIVACPSALQAGWGSKANEPLVNNLIEELALTFNIDLNRVYVAGHSMGGFGAYIWGAKRKDLWAGCSPNAGGGAADPIVGAGVPIFIYHGSDDRIVGPSGDRANAKGLVGKKKIDFVYTELDGVGHGWPGEVRKEMFRYFQGRWKDRGKKRATGPDSSFDRKVGKEEIKTFGDPSKAPVEEGRGDKKLKPLLDAIKLGGGNGATAAVELGKLGDPATAKAVAKLLRSKKSSVDTRVLAAYALGRMGIPEVLKPLDKALGDKDFRVLSEATIALGHSGLPEAVPSLTKAAKHMRERLENSFYAPSRMTHTEYGIRLEAFGHLCDAYGALGDAAAALPVLDEHVIRGIYVRKEPIDTGNDKRFVREPPAARHALMKKLAGALEKLGDPAGADLLDRVVAAWGGESSLVAIANAAIAKLRGP